MPSLTVMLEGFDTCGPERERWADLERLIRWYFGPVEAANAIYVAWHASRMEALAFHKDGTDGIGLFGLKACDCGLDVKDSWLLQNPIRNVAAAHKLWSQHGWAFWPFPPCPAPFLDYANSLKE